MPIILDNSVKNLYQSPGIITDIFANIPGSATYGTIFIASDTGDMYSFDGITWNSIGGGGSTPGIDSVLAIGQLFTTDRTIDANNNIFHINNNKVFDITNSITRSAFYTDVDETNVGIMEAGSVGAFLYFSNDGQGTVKMTDTSGWGKGFYFGLLANYFYYGVLDTATSHHHLLLQTYTTATADEDYTFRFYSWQFNWTFAGAWLNLNGGDRQLYQYGHKLRQTDQVCLQIDITNSQSLQDVALYTDTRRNALHYSVDLVTGIFFVKYGLDLDNAIGEQQQLVFERDGKIVYLQYSTGSSTETFMHFDMLNAISVFGSYVTNPVNLTIYGTVGNEKIYFADNSGSPWFGMFLDVQTRETWHGSLDGQLLGMYTDSSSSYIYLYTGANGINLDDNGTGSLISPSSGGNSGQHLVLNINGSQYKIALLDP